MIDALDLDVVAGHGGNGAVSFRREKFQPQGGPDGGDGGRGGDVILVADARMSTLNAYADGAPRRAEHGSAGGSNQKRGASAKPLVLPVPVGTVIWDADQGGDEALADLSVAGARVVVARGGRGGLGNRRFATATRQAPKFAQRGSTGERRRLRCELKLLADVGLVGLPNAGKSTLLSALTRARPKIGAYPFTTLEPELGVAEVDHETFVVADMPGLIEGASAGVGLGHEFLRHIERTRLLVHVLDMSEEDPLAAHAMINAELAAFGHGLAEKPQLLALNKVDDPDARARVELLDDAVRAIGAPAYIVSAATGEGVRDLARACLARLRALRDAEQAAVSAAVPVIEIEPARRTRFEVSVAPDGMVCVDGPTPNWLAQTLDVDDLEPRQELLARLRRMGVARELARAGVADGDRIRVGGVEVRWE